VRSAYASIMKDVHSGFACKESGLIVSNEHPFIGASPDGHELVGKLELVAQSSFLQLLYSKSANAIQDVDTLKG